MRRVVLAYRLGRRRAYRTTFFSAARSFPAGFAVQQLVQIPADPAQQVTSLQTDSKGNVIISAIGSYTNVLTTIPPGEGAFVVKLHGQDGTIAYATEWGDALAPGGSFVISGTSNVAAYVEPGGSSSPNMYAVVGAAGTSVTGQVAQGELISLYGANLGPAIPATADLRSGQAPTQLGGVQVLVNGTPAPLLYAQSDQINAIVPFGIAPSGVANPTTHIVVSNSVAKSNEAVLGVVAAQPDAFKLNAKLWAAALNQDGSINSAANHAKLGSLVSVFATGFGGMTPEPRDGQLITGTLPKLAAPVQVLYQGGGDLRRPGADVDRRRHTGQLSLADVHGHIGGAVPIRCGRLGKRRLRRAGGIAVCCNHLVSR